MVLLALNKPPHKSKDGKDSLELGRGQIRTLSPPADFEKKHNEQLHDRYVRA